jgi:hypothetical protein
MTGWLQEYRKAMADRDAQDEQRYRVRVIQPPRADWAKPQHVTMRVQRADGLWVTDCLCGWTSAPAAHREELGWACAKQDAEVKK